MTKTRLLLTGVRHRNARKQRRAGAVRWTSVLGALTLFGTCVAAPPPGYPDSPYSVFLPYLNAADLVQGRDVVPRLALSFGGRPVHATMDTGSTGIAVSAHLIPAANASTGKAGHITYTSSGRIMRGHWVRTAVQITGADATVLTTQPIEVLAVSRIDCLQQARHCTPQDKPAGVAMMGVGFGREYNLQPQGTPDKNPFLNVAWPAGASGRTVRGYVVTREGVHVGLTAGVTQGNVRYMSLAKDPTIAGEWQGVSVCMSVDGRLPAACGNGLVDTGVTGMFVTLPPQQLSGNKSLASNNVLTIGFVDANVGTPPQATTPPATATKSSAATPAAAHVHYSVSPPRPNAHGASPMTPTGIVVNTSRPAPFVNTGVRFLQGYDVLYDADRGLYGFRQR